MHEPHYLVVDWKRVSLFGTFSHEDPICIHNKKMEGTLGLIHKEVEGKKKKGCSNTSHGYVVENAQQRTLQRNIPPKVEGRE